MKTRFVGIDGCKTGWFCVYINSDDTWAFAVFEDIETATKRLSRTQTLLIDIPIGLVEAHHPTRACDVQARKLLGRKRASSVFSPPARATLAAKNYRHALAVNRAVVSRGLSKESWNIVPKIRQVDRLLCSRPTMNNRLRESHPEICFWALNDRQAMLHNKKTSQGRQERLNVLAHYFPPAEELFEQASQCYLRRQVALDDIFDAMVLAVVAKCGAQRYSTLPMDVPLDSKGLRMEMVYWLP